MAKNGTIKIYLAHVMRDIDGMDNYVKDPLFVRMEEYGILFISNVFAPKALTGLALHAQQYKNVVVGNILTLLFLDVSVSRDFNGMVRFVFNVIMEKYGMSLH